MIDIRISATAFLKMQTLVAGYGHEVGWYGTAEKTSDHAYRIMDVLVYPQYASAAYIDDRDTTEMPLWFQSLSDEVYDHKRFHGHSHVNMGVRPSSTDKKTYEQFKRQNSNATINRFTIELIMNKKFEMYWKVHDAVADKEYGNEEINVEIEITENETMAAFFENSRKNVRKLRNCSDFLLTGVPTKVQVHEGLGRVEKPTKKRGKSGFSIRISDKGFDVEAKLVPSGPHTVFDVHGTPYKFADRSRTAKDHGTVLSALLRVANEPIEDCFMVYDMDNEKILTPFDFDKIADMFHLPVKGKETVSSNGLDVLVILV